MSWTKRQFVEAAFEEIGLATYVYDLQPEQLNMALRRLDAMMGTWNAKGIRIGYPLPSTAGSSDLDEDANVPDSAYQAMILGLAIQLASGFGKTVSMDTRRAYKDAFNALLTQIANVIEMQMPNTMPMGAGHKPWRTTNNEFMPDQNDPLLAGNDGAIDFE